MAAIANCTKVLTDPNGYNLSKAAALKAFASLSLYTNAESCPMVRRLHQTQDYRSPTSVRFCYPVGRL
jgi:hypothetical protein